MLCNAEQSKAPVAEASMFRPFLVATVFASTLFTTSLARAQFLGPCVDPPNCCYEWCYDCMDTAPGCWADFQFNECMEAISEGCVDSDGDGLADTVESLMLGTDPEASDSDGDGLSDAVELFLTGTDPINADTDNDGVLDGDDPTPGGTTAPLENSMRTLAENYISSQSLSCFKGGNDTARQARRTNLAASISMAADMAQAGKANAAKGILTGVLASLDILVVSPTVRNQITNKLTNSVNLLDGLAHP